MSKNKINPEIKDKLSKNDVKTLDNLSLWQKMKYINALPRIYDGLCKDCKKKAFSKVATQIDNKKLSALAYQKMKLEDFCDKCRERSTRILKNVLR